jgi:hypothetical protein
MASEYFSKVQVDGENVTITRTVVSAKEARKGTVGFPSASLATDDDYRAIGYWPHVGTKPAHTATQHVTGPTFTPNAVNETIVKAWVVTDFTLAEQKAAMLGTLRARFQAVRDAGTTINFGTGDVAIRTTPEAKSDVESLHDDLLLREAGGEVDPTQDIATSEYVVVPGVTIAMAADMREAVAAHWRATWARDAALGAAIQAAADGAALDLIDVQAGSIDGAGGWPG